MTNLISSTVSSSVPFMDQAQPSGASGGGFFEEFSRAQDQARQSSSSSPAPAQSQAPPSPAINQPNVQSSNPADSNGDNTTQGAIPSADNNKPNPAAGPGNGPGAAAKQPGNKPDNPGDPSTMDANRSNADKSPVAQDGHGPVDPVILQTVTQASQGDAQTSQVEKQGIVKAKKVPTDAANLAAAAAQLAQPYPAGATAAPTEANPSPAADPTAGTTTAAQASTPSPAGVGIAPVGQGNADASDPSAIHPKVALFKQKPDGQVTDVNSDSDVPTSSATSSAPEDSSKPRSVNKLDATGSLPLADPLASQPAAATKTSDAATTGNIPSIPIPVAEAQFSQSNHANIVQAIHGSLLPNGGTMQIRLDPPELGALNISVTMDQGTMSASFETSTDQATRLLTHTLGQLKDALETQGVAVQRLHVHQTSPGENSNPSSSDEGSHQRETADESGAHQQQQRREMLRRMWQRVSGNRDPLDLVA